MQYTSLPPYSLLGILDAAGAEVTLHLALVDTVVAQREEEAIYDAEPKAVTLVRVQIQAAEDETVLGTEWLMGRVYVKAYKKRYMWFP